MNSTDQNHEFPRLAPGIFAKTTTYIGFSSTALAWTTQSTSFFFFFPSRLLIHVGCSHTLYSEISNSSLGEGGLFPSVLLPSLISLLRLPQQYHRAGASNNRNLLPHNSGASRPGPRRQQVQFLSALCLPYRWSPSCWILTRSFPVRMHPCLALHVLVPSARLDEGLP